ncbi:ATP-binding cassette domain-containing protein [Eoetvoesiella caeni]|uniref:ABC-2 type transport system ATP-binding protein n=1 Tax=Eoetvoesiella caeni TaxID=645616 RepID=A0A366HHP2_9BURK|nr:ATP-binding cassette domain-containing protein [Eoetvoesiella caeni]MCI2808259.1 ATP-binding cassette domain-containing protein [Eoetvoesiella caeni]NYT53738.1 ABC transporter ATP-binding protein [Eoetvoesiella caeni]RBP42184.1 ABC-2 type transport system ATP-binding protein [Eoetvoesiella caeni]
MNSPAPALSARGLSKHFLAKGLRQTALDDVSFEAQASALSALVGPDAAGKTTMLRLAAGLMHASHGELSVFGLDVAAHPQSVQDRISYMPQRFGLYDDLSVQENLDLYADLHGVPRNERGPRYARLMEMTDLGRFTGRLAGKLSGGMKQKLGLACTLVRSPELLLLDEPTAGVDPLSRRDLWEILEHLVQKEGLAVLISTSYLDEAARCSHVVVLHQGQLLAQGAPQTISQKAGGLCFLATPAPNQPARSLQVRLLDAPETLDAVPRAGQVHFIRSARAVQQGDPALAAVLDHASHTSTPPTLEDGFMVMLRTQGQPDARPHAPAPASERAPAEHAAGDTVIEVKNLVRKFGDFVAVDNTTFNVRRGEIFGLLGPNGAGKTTTFRMLCGLLPATSGELKVAGNNLRTAGAQARLKIGYVAQRFALYGNLSVQENLVFFGGAYGLYGKRLRERIEAAMDQFQLREHSRAAAGQLPGGFKQRLAMAAGLLHEPDILFLDEPTSGADPLARREFWRRITALAEQGTTVVITTHFMEEAEYCDRVVIQDAGRILAMGTPLEIRRQAGNAQGAQITMEQAFIDIVERARRQDADEDASGTAHPSTAAAEEGAS